ncbi:Pol Polyprotein [Phytophthora megakarya]|uniref:Pol Polyprotein n=1 Tax=Phytophthora megakarya TaxID=4795 RepID=A0A225W239_9STRA|nr:Pol Polyprotein [Phytophthora megakarya]
MLKTMQNVLPWTIMARDIEQHLCQNKHPTVKYGKPPEKTVITRPWFEVAIDSIGPYGKQKFGTLTMIEPSGDAGCGGCLQQRSRLHLRPTATRELRHRRVPTTTRNPQANGIIEPLHRVVSDKMRTQQIVTQGDWENFLQNSTFTLKESVHSMLGVSPAQATFGRDMIFDVEHSTD